MMVFLEFSIHMNSSQIFHVTVILVSVVIYGGGFTAMVFMEIIVFLLTIQKNRQ